MHVAQRFDRKALMAELKLGAIWMGKEEDAHESGRLVRQDAHGPRVDQFFRRPDALEAPGDPGDRAINLAVG